MFPDASTLLFRDDNVETKDYVWVNADSFRRFLSCEKGLDHKLKSSDPIVCSESMLCSHERLHPSTASKGKLLRKPVFDAYVALLAGERRYLTRNEVDSAQGSVVGREIRATDDLICKTCLESRKDVLKERTELIKNMMDLYHAFISQDGMSKDEDPSFYVIPQTWMTQFKKLFLELAKSVGAFEEGEVLEFEKAKAGITFSGLDSVDIKALMGISSNAAPAKTKKGKDVPEMKLDPKVNTKITCKYSSLVLGPWH